MCIVMQTAADCSTHFRQRGRCKDKTLIKARYRQCEEYFIFDQPQDLGNILRLSPER